MTDLLIVGAGLFGATCARLLSEADYSVKVIERRNHIAGNCHDTQLEGVTVSCYGGHIFHTNAPRIWHFVRRFAEWQPYEHRVKAVASGVVYSFPPNRLTAQQLGINLDDDEAEGVIRKTFFVGYSEKQWGRPYSEIPRSVTRRIPIRDSYDDRYFSDKYQGVPIGGYTAMVANMLTGIKVETGADYVKDRGYWDKQAKTVIYTGALDELFDYSIGMLEYRSLRHETRILPSDVIGAATLNYCDKGVPYTRIINWRTIGYQDGNVWPVTWEYPADKGEKYYPVPTESNHELHGLYETLCKREAANIRPGGRLGLYQYLNMDQAIGAAMRLVDKVTGE